MTTAGRPTWAPAKGGNDQGGSRIFGPSSSRDMAGHTRLKPRREGQDRKEEVEKRNLREELEERERRHLSTKEDRNRRKSGQLLLLEGSRTRRDHIVPRSSIDAADDPDMDDESDDEEALLAELELVRKEKQEQLKAKEEQVLVGNPLLLNNPANSFCSVKRRWDDDVVFKKQARGGETKTPKRFINDTMRSDFHRKFLRRYIN